MTHNWELLSGGEPGQDLSSFWRPGLEVLSHRLFLLFPPLPPQVLESQHPSLKTSSGIAASPHLVCVEKHLSTYRLVCMRYPCWGAVWHGRSLAGKHGEGVGPIQHGAEGVRGCRGRGGGRRGGAAFTGPAPGLCICHLGGEEVGDLSWYRAIKENQLWFSRQWWIEISVI